MWLEGMRVSVEARLDGLYDGRKLKHFLCSMILSHKFKGETIKHVSRNSLFHKAGRIAQSSPNGECMTESECYQSLRKVNWAESLEKLDNAW